MAAFVCFVLATAVTLLDLFTSKYPTTWWVLIKRVGPYFYAVIYGLLAAGAFAFFGDAIKLSAPAGVRPDLVESPWTKAVLVGLFTRSIMQMTLLTVGPTPIGLKTLTLLFEPFFLRSLLLAEFKDVRVYVSPLAAKYPVLADVKAKINTNTPSALPDEERVAFQAAIDREDNVLGAMERYLRFVGKDLFNSTFP